MDTPNIDSELVESIASDTHTPVDIVSRMFAETWAEYSEGARITDYLSVLVSKRVRENLLRWQQDSH